MSQNPYANPYPQQYAQPYPPGYNAGVTARTSILAVLSLVFSLLCCTAPLGVLFGGLALVAIALSGGKVKGIGLAIAGLIIGIIVTVVVLGSAFAAVAGLNVFAQPTSSAFEAIEQRDAATLRGLFVQSRQDEVSDERVAEFAGIVASDIGDFDRVPNGFGEWWSGYGEAAFNPIGAQAIEDAENDYATGMVPLPVMFDGDWKLIFVVIDQANTGGNNLPLYQDIGVVRDDGSIEWLLADAGTTAGSGGRFIPPVVLPDLPAGVDQPEDDEPEPARTPTRRTPKL